MRVIQENRRLVLLALVVSVLLCLVGVLIFNVFSPGGGTDVVQPPPTATPEPTQEGPDVGVTPEDATPTPTRVILEEPTKEPVPEPTEEPVPEPTEEVEPTVVPTIQSIIVAQSDSDAADFAAPLSGQSVIQVEELFKNGDFEEGFDETTGVGLNWQSFNSGGAAMAFSHEASDLFIYDGFRAQRISVENSLYTDRYAGIYQKVEVIPNETYAFTIRGQIRSPYGDVNASGYGYRVQYAVDYNGGENWQAITNTAWIELPWDEQQLNTSNISFSEYTDQITARSNQVTLFIRTWNKWADPKLVEYTFDGLSFVGPAPGSVMMAGTDPGTDAGTEEGQLFDQPLPITGTGDPPSFITDGRFWGALLVLLLLAVGATYRARWRW